MRGCQEVIERHSHGSVIGGVGHVQLSTHDAALADRHGDDAAIDPEEEIRQGSPTSAGPPATSGDWARCPGVSLALKVSATLARAMLTPKEQGRHQCRPCPFDDPGLNRLRRGTGADNVAGLSIMTWLPRTSRPIAVMVCAVIASGTPTTSVVGMRRRMPAEPHSQAVPATAGDIVVVHRQSERPSGIAVSCRTGHGHVEDDDGHRADTFGEG